MGKRTAEKADSEKGLFADAQSLKQSSLRCGTRFVGAAEEPRLAELRFVPCYSFSQTARRAAISSPHPESLSFGVSR